MSTLLKGVSFVVHCPWSIVYGLSSIINYICSMEVNDALVEKLANLSRLTFNEEEKQAIKKDLQNMISFVDKLNELDTTGVEPLLHVSDNINILRTDEEKGSITREKA